MHNLGSSRERKLRAACDRCHDLKNRCVRTGGVDSRCNRCERLDIDCVYRNTSRIGRPRSQKQAAVITDDRGAAGRPGLGQRVESRDSNQGPPPTANNDPPWAAQRAPTATSHAPDLVAQVRTPLMGSPTDVMSLLVPPEAVRQADMDWTLDFSSHIDNGCVPLTLVEPSEARLPTPPQARSPKASGCQQSSRTMASAEETTEGLLNLQGQLHQLLWAMNNGSTTDFVEDSLEAIKTFLELLEASLDEQQRNRHLPNGRGSVDLVPDVSGATTMAASMNSSNCRIDSANGGEAIAGGFPEGAGSTDDSSFSGVNSSGSAVEAIRHGKLEGLKIAYSTTDYIMAQQALTCYSYMLLVLDHSVTMLSNNNQYSSTSRFGHRDRRASDLSSQGSTTSNATAVFSLGFFNLSSQPALNVEVVAHLMLRMVQRSRGLVQAIVTGDCARNPVPSDQSPSLSTGSVAPRERGGRSLSIAEGGSSRSTIMHELAEVFGEKEENLINRLSCLTGGA